MAHPLDGLRIVDLSTGIAGSYCTKLLADGGADVIKVEGPGGDPLRRWSASGASLAPGTDGALFNFLNASKRSVLAAEGYPADLVAEADAVVWSPGVTARPPVADRAVVTAITPFGLGTPWEARPATEFTLQAWSGAVIGLGRGHPDRPPVHVGGQVGEWLTGLWAAIGTLAALRTGGSGRLVDVSMLECLASCLTYYPVTFADLLGRPMRKKRFVPTPGVHQAADGLVGLGVGTGQQWLDFCVMVGHPEWKDEPRYFLDRTSLAPEIEAWTAERKVGDILDLAAAFRIPNAPIAHGGNLAGIDHFRQRDAFVANPRDGAQNPRPPWRFHHTALELRPPAPAPALGEHTGTSFGPRQHTIRADRRYPFEGLRVLDMTSYWAGPLAGHVLALLGAEVVHLESEARPDGARTVGGVPQTEDRALERGPIFAALNTNKKSLCIDVRHPEGVERLKRFISTCDVVIENYTPRVLDQIGLSYLDLRPHRPDLIMVRMPGFGLDGPWRDNAAFAFVIEDASGLTWMTGHPDRLPYEPYCVGDPNAGLHALYGLMLALEHRDRTGEGCLVESAMVDAALNITAEQPIEHSAYGSLLARQGNRGPQAAPQGIYRAADRSGAAKDGPWVAIAVAGDQQWVSLRRVLGDPEWADDEQLDTAAGRRQHHDLIDAALAEWCSTRPPEEIVDLLLAAGVATAPVMQPHEQPGLDPMVHRGYFEELDHPVAGRARYSTLPMRLSWLPGPFHRRPAPLLGEHTAELLGP